MADPIIKVPSFLCTSTPEFTFCAPAAGADFYLAIAPAADHPQREDAARINAWFGRECFTSDDEHSAPRLVETAPAGTNIPKGFRIYNVTAFLPKVVTEKNGTYGDAVGPNCYDTALRAEGYSVGERHVTPDEFRYYLKRDFEPISCNAKNLGGAIAVYDQSLFSFGAGWHAAYILIGGKLVFHKGGWQSYYPYEVVPIGGAMKAIEKEWQPLPAYLSDGPEINPITGREFTHACYDKKSPAPVETEPSTERDLKERGRDRKWFLKFFNYYSGLLKGVSKFEWGDFRKNRIDLLTMENMWRVLGEFSERVGNINVIDKLLSLDNRVAESYYELYSLDWQYQAMVETYDRIREGSSEAQLARLYKDHYVTFGKDFYDELGLVLELWEVPDGSRGKVTEDFKAKLESYDYTKYAQSNGGQGIPYFDLLDATVRSVVSDWQRPAGFGEKAMMAFGTADPELIAVSERKESPFGKRRHALAIEPEKKKP